MFRCATKSTVVGYRSSRFSALSTFLGDQFVNQIAAGAWTRRGMGELTITRYGPSSG